MNQHVRSCVIHLDEARAAIPWAEGQHAVEVLRRGTLNVRLSCPTPPNRQTPHEQDEIYVVMSGRGVLVADGERTPFEGGDLMFVAAGTEHHFEEFTEDIAVWVIFYGPPGGEVPA